jgi:hypothetical protein
MSEIAAPPKRKSRIPDTVWREVEQRACGGVTLQTLSDAYGIGVATLNDRSKRYEWKTPARLARRSKAAWPERKTHVAVNEIQAPLELGLAELSQCADESPTDFHIALAKVVQQAIASGFTNIPPPRAVGELKIFSDIHRKAAGVDANECWGSVSRINPMHSISRRPRG